MKPEANSTNIHVFRVNRTVKNKEQSQSSNRVSPASVPVNSRTSLSAETKRLICEDHINNPRYTQEALASKYGCKRTTVAKVSLRAVFDSFAS
jgi:predicted transcriptional regulator